MKSWVKKLCAVAIVCAVALCLAACGGSKGGSDTGSAKTAKESQTITFPKAYFNSIDSAACKTQLEDAGCTDVQDNGDGSFTATVSADAFNTISSDLHTQITDAQETLENDKNTYPDIESIDISDDFSNITITLNTEQASIEDTFAPAMLGVPAANYQQITGMNVGCHVELVSKGGTTLNEYDYPTA